MRLIQQSNFGECGAACLAMVLGLPLALVLEKLAWVFPAMDLKTHGMTDDDMILFLKGYDLLAKVTTEPPGESPAILIVPSLNHLGMLHYIVWDGEEFLDPSNEQLRYPGDGPVIAGEKTVCWAVAIVWEVSDDS